jgi:N6-L-threonylcarbamoyladenine synthase
MATVSQTQIEPHAIFGGIVPEAASRIHIQIIDEVCRSALDQAGIDVASIGAVAVTVGPGLPGSLMVGLEFGRGLAYGMDVPLIPVNHLEGHIAAAWLDFEHVPDLPAVALIVSGGHTELVCVDAPGSYRVIGRTRDDAAGEAFDKVARMLGLGFPGGPMIEQAAATVASTPIKLPRAWLVGTSDFSFSGLKAAVQRLHDDQLGPEEASRIFSNSAVWTTSSDRSNRVADIALAFEQAVVDVLVRKTIEAAESHRVRSIILTGGVAANSRLRKEMQAASPVPLHVPLPIRCTDNAAMIGVAAAWTIARGYQPSGHIDIDPGLRLA